MKIRFDYSERIDLDKLLNSLKEFISYNKSYCFDIFFKNGMYKVELSNQIPTEIRLLTFRMNQESDSVKRTYNPVGGDFFNVYPSLMESYETNYFTYTNINDALKDFEYLIKCVYFSEKLDVF